MNKPIVSIAVTTYNQEDYIANTLDSLLMQQTNFDFVIVIGEDCSSDNTLSILHVYQSKYPNKILLLDSNKNYGSDLNLLRTIKACSGKFIAICDGDDYWIDSNKLQKQVDFLEQNSTYGTVATLRKDFMEDSNSFISIATNFTGAYSSIDFKDFLFKNYITASTVLFRSDLMCDFLDFFKSNNAISFNDYNFFLFFAHKMDVAILNVVTTVYRILPESGSHSNDPVKVWSFRKRFYVAIKFYLDFFKIDSSSKNSVLHYRATVDYLFACNSKDFVTCNEFLQIFKDNKDFLRFFLLKMGMKNSTWNGFSFFIEKVNLRLGGVLLGKV